MRWTFFVAMARGASAAQVAATTVKAGVEAWQRGDHAAATAIWRKLADKGDADAAFNLGQAYRLGRGVPTDAALAKRWFEAAAKKGHLDAQVSLGLLLFDSGQRGAAMEWLRKAADRGEPRALLVIGTAMFNGDGVTQDPVRGYAFVSWAAAQGLAPAKTTLAEMDRILPLTDRQRGVAIALDLAKAPERAKPAPRTAAAKPPAPAKALPPSAKPAVASAKPSAPPPVAMGGTYRIQLGAFSTRGAAQALFAKLQGKLGGAQPAYVPVGTMTRLQVGPYRDRAAANAACAKLAPQACFAVPIK